MRSKIVLFEILSQLELLPQHLTVGTKKINACHRCSTISILILPLEDDSSTFGETAIRLGINKPEKFPTKALQSTASNFVWPVDPTPGAGGAIQYYIPNKNVFTPLTRTYAKP